MTTISQGAGEDCTYMHEVGSAKGPASVKATDRTIYSYSEPKAGMPVPMDMTDIYAYEAMVEEITGVNGVNGPFYMREFLKAKELSSSYYCRLMFDYEQARNKTKEEYALAYLERSETYIRERNLKATDETKKNYVLIDRRYQEAKDREDMLKALVTLMGNKVDKFQAAHDDAKRIYSQAGDPRGSLPGLPSSKDAQ